MIDEHMPFSEKQPGIEPSIVPRRIGSLRWVMQVRRIVARGVERLHPAAQIAERNRLSFAQYRLSR
jgi:hypothetical protein